MLAVFTCAVAAAQAVNNLHKAGFGAASLSVIARDEGAIDGKTLVRVPGAGRVVALGPIAAEPSCRLAPLLLRVGISAGAARTYEAAIRGGQTLVLFHGAAKEMRKARAWLFKHL